MDYTKTGAQLIADERKRQIEKEGWTSEHDDAHKLGELEDAAACYRYHGEELKPPYAWPWDAEWWKPTPGEPIRALIKAGALYQAELDRMYRAGFDGLLFPLIGDTKRQVQAVAQKIDELLRGLKQS